MNLSPRRWIVLACLVLSAGGCESPGPAARYGKLDADGEFRFHNAAAVAAFRDAHGDELCARAMDEGYAWEAHLSAELPPQIVPAYLAWYRRGHPEDSRWGLDRCPATVGLAPGVLAEHGRLLAGERFVFASPARAEAFWAHLREAGLACLRDDGVATLLTPDLALELALAALEYWRRAGVVSLQADACEIRRRP